MFNKYLVTEEDFVVDLDRRLKDSNIQLLNFEYVDNIIKVEFELNGTEEEYIEYVRNRVESVIIRIVNKYFNIYGQAIDDTFYFEKNSENIIKIELF